MKKKPTYKQIVTNLKEYLENIEKINYSVAHSFELTDREMYVGMLHYSMEDNHILHLLNNPEELKQHMTIIGLEWKEN